MKLDATQIIQAPRVTEKSVYVQNALGAYTFKVHPDANKIQIKQAVEELFGVSVKQVRVSNQDGKQRRTRAGIGFTADWKKAVVTIADGQQIEGSDSMAMRKLKPYSPGTRHATVPDFAEITKSTQRSH